MSEPIKLSDTLEVIRYANGVIEFWEHPVSDEEGGFRLTGTESDELVKWIKSLPIKFNSGSNLINDIHYLHNEVDCRISHGASSGGHLEYVKTCLEQIISAHNASQQ